MAGVSPTNSANRGSVEVLVHDPWGVYTSQTKRSPARPQTLTRRPGTLDMRGCCADSPFILAISLWPLEASSPEELWRADLDELSAALPADA